jgi:cysteine desulfurase family protein (TIGR01976 family)
MAAATERAVRPDVAAIRRQFHSLSSGTVFFENAGGTQMPRVVADAMHHYLLNTFVNTGASYEPSKTATQIVRGAHDLINLLLGGPETGYVALGASSSILCRLLADAYGEALQAGDEVIVAQNGHESYIGPWMRLARLGIRIVVWKVDRQAMDCRVEDLCRLLSSRTRLVVFPHVSNILGNIADVAAITRRVHEVGAKVVVDGVAYVPHRLPDVAAWDVDWYGYSTYKVFGPHMAALYGRKDAFEALPPPNHFFITKVPGRFELGGACHEGCAGLLALGRYLNFLAGREPVAALNRQTVVEAYATVAEQENTLTARLIDYLKSRPGVRIIGPAHAEPSRVSLVSFVHATRPPSEIVAATDAENIGIKYGHMSAYRLCEGLGLDPAKGVVRVSMAHYNTVGEVDRLTRVLDRVL